MNEPWLDRKKLAEWYSGSVRSVEDAIKAGMPGAIIFGRKKWKISVVEPWLLEHGFIRNVDDGCTVVTGSNTGAATAATAPPHDREVGPDGNQA